MSDFIKNSHFVQLFVLKTPLSAFIIISVESISIQHKIFDSKVSPNTYTYSQNLIHSMKRFKL
jgi:hypothetical protein